MCTKPFDCNKTCYQETFGSSHGDTNYTNKLCECCSKSREKYVTKNQSCMSIDEPKPKRKSSRKIKTKKGSKECTREICECSSLPQSKGINIASSRSEISMDDTKSNYKKCKKIKKEKLKKHTRKKNAHESNLCSCCSSILTSTSSVTFTEKKKKHEKKPKKDKKSKRSRKCFSTSESNVTQSESGTDTKLKTSKKRRQFFLSRCRSKHEKKPRLEENKANDSCTCFSDSGNSYSSSKSKSNEYLTASSSEIERKRKPRKKPKKEKKEKKNKQSSSIEQSQDSLSSCCSTKASKSSKTLNEKKHKPKRAKKEKKNKKNSSIELSQDSLCSCCSSADSKSSKTSNEKKHKPKRAKKEKKDKKTKCVHECTSQLEPMSIADNDSTLLQHTPAGNKSVKRLKLPKMRKEKKKKTTCDDISSLETKESICCMDNNASIHIQSPSCCLGHEALIQNICEYSNKDFSAQAASMDQGSACTARNAYGSQTSFDKPSSLVENPMLNCRFPEVNNCEIPCINLETRFNDINTTCAELVFPNTPKSKKALETDPYTFLYWRQTLNNQINFKNAD